MSTNLFSLKDVTFSYEDGRPIFKNMNLDIPPNALIVIKGESGAGKSTLLKLLNRFCDPGQSNIYFHDRSLKDYHVDKLRSKVIYLPQLPVMIEGTIEDNLKLPFSFHSHKEKTYRVEKAMEWLSYFQLHAPLHSEALKLSIGQRQRVALVRSLLLKPEVLLMDEPCSALDPKNKKLIEHKIESLTAESRLTIVMATHSEVTFTGAHYSLYKLKDERLHMIPISLPSLADTNGKIS